MPTASARNVSSAAPRPLVVVGLASQTSSSPSSEQDELDDQDGDFMRASAFFALSLVLVLAGSAAAENQKVTAEQLPPAVWKTIQTNADGRQPTSITREETGGVITYEVVLPAGGGKDRTMTVGATGALISIQVALTETPAAVQKTIAANLNGGFDRRHLATKKIIPWRQRGQRCPMMWISPRRTVRNAASPIVDDGTAAERPDCAGWGRYLRRCRARSRHAATDGKIGEVERQIDDGVVSYEVTFTNKAGAERTFTISAEGKLTRYGRRLLAEAAASPAACASIHKTGIGAGTLQRVMETLIPHVAGDLLRSGGSRRRQAGGV